jgi:HEAT repeat protein
MHIGAPVQSFGAVALVAIGFFGAKLLPTERGSLQSMSAIGPVYERVREVEPNGQSGQVQIVVEQVSRRTLSGGMSDEPIRRLLLAAARESNDPGVRVESVDFLKGSGSQTDVREALLQAIQHDSNPGVRLKALEALRSSAADEEVRKVLARVLLTDDNEGIRTQAIDLLTAKADKEPALIGVLQQLMVKEDNSYVRSRCQRALHEMKASAETF